MPDDTSALPSETPSDATMSETLTTQATSETPDAPIDTSSDLSKELERLKTSLKRANAEAKQFREKATELDALKKRTEDEKLSETERLQKELSELKAQREEEQRSQLERTIQQEAIAQAAELGVNPKHLKKVARFLDWEDIDVDERGNPINIRDMIEALVKEMPELLLRSAAPAESGKSVPAVPPMNPGRSNITAPGQLPPGKMSIEEAYRQARTGK